MMQETEDKPKIFMALPRRWLAILIVTLLIASVGVRFVISTINNASLAEAVQDSNHDKIKTLLENEVNPNGTLSQGVTYLDHAAQKGNLWLAKLLLDHGADPNIVGIGGRSPLSRAIEKNQSSVAQLLLKRGAKLPASGAPNLLHHAAKHGDILIVKLLLDRGADIEAPFPNGMRLIEYAVNTNKLDLVRLLLNRRVNDLNGGILPETRIDDQPLIEWAVRHTFVELVGILIDHGANPNLVTDEGQSLLALAVKVNKPDLVQLLLSRKADYSVLIRRALKGKDISVLTKLLDGGVPSDSKVDDQPLIEWAVRNAFVKFVGILIKHGANPDLVTREGQSLLALAVALDLPEVAGALVDHGADINAKVTTPVSDAFTSLFKTKYARFYLIKDSGLTPIMLAILRKRQDTVRTLLARKARLDTPTKKHGTWPLGFAAYKKDVEMMQLLLGRDPDPAKQKRHIQISLRKQTAILYVNGKVALKTRVSTGRKGYATPPGKYVITNKYRKWMSTIYKVPMPYFMRLNASSIGLHQGRVPRRPASHGCIRVPKGNIARLFAATKVGDLVTIAR